MQIAAGRLHNSGKPGWLRTVVLTAGLVLLVVGTFQPAGATQQEDPSENAKWQMALCEAGGGTIEVSVWRNPNGLSGTLTYCRGGLFDGVQCKNTPLGIWCEDYTPATTGGSDASSRWPVAEVVDVLETGSVPQIKVVLADLQADIGNSQIVAADDYDQDHDQDASKNKKGKKGKRGGKGRR